MIRFFTAFGDTVRGALRTLGANKLRSALTLLGIVIGVLAVVAMAATIEGLRIQINDSMAQLGSGVFQVQKEPHNDGGFGGGDRWRHYGRRKNFTIADVDLLQQKCQRCLHVAGEAWEFGITIGHVGGPEVAQTIAVAGGTPWFFDNNGFALAEGRLYDDGEVARGAAVAVVGADVVDAIFANRNPIGQLLTIKGKPYRVIGVLERRGGNMFGSMDGMVSIPLPNYLEQFGAKQSLNLTIAAKDPGKLEDTQDEVVTILRTARGVKPEAENDFEMFSNDSVQEEFADMSSKIATVTTGICAIALLIGGIGVMNIMLVAVTERTSEIGVRRALGARRRRILAQFVIEAVFLCATGGVVGILLGALTAFLVKVFVDIPTVVPAWAIALSIVASSVVGLGFGIYPAWRASRLDPVEAMRQE
jgi:putative ABC transport system permease protein